MFITDEERKQVVELYKQCNELFAGKSNYIVAMALCMCWFGAGSIDLVKNITQEMDKALNSKEQYPEGSPFHTSVPKKDIIN